MVDVHFSRMTIFYFQIVLSGMKHISKGKTYDNLQPWLGTGLLTSTGQLDL